MAITKQITASTGVVYEHHKVMSIMIDPVDSVYANVHSWVNAYRSDGKPINTFCIQVHTPVAPNLVATAESLLVADPNGVFFGGVITPDATVSDLDKAKAKKRAEIAAARSAEMYADKTTTLGVFGSTEADNNKLSIAIQVTQLAAAAGKPAECGYKTADGAYSVYTLAQLEQIALEIAAQVIPLYEKEAILTVSIEAAVTVEELNLINW